MVQYCNKGLLCTRHSVFPVEECDALCLGTGEAAGDELMS